MYFFKVWFAMLLLILQQLNDVLRKVEHGYQMDPPEGCPPQVYDLMKRAWNLKPDLRPTFHDVRILLGHLRSTTTGGTGSSSLSSSYLKS